MEYFGFLPRLGKCVNCNLEANKFEEKFFSIKDNGLKCVSCARQDKGAIAISSVTYTSLLYILSSEPKKLFSFEIPKDKINELKLVAKIYTNEKLEKEYKII